MSQLSQILCLFGIASGGLAIISFFEHTWLALALIVLALILFAAGYFVNNSRATEPEPTAVEPPVPESSTPEPPTPELSTEERVIARIAKLTGVPRESISKDTPLSRFTGDGNFGMVVATLTMEFDEFGGQLSIQDSEASNIGTILAELN